MVVHMLERVLHVLFKIHPKEILEASCITMIIVGIFTIIATLIVKAPYGRYSTNKGWGFLVPAKYAWFIMESPNLWVTAIGFLFSRNRNQLDNPTSIVLLSCFLLHYMNRSIIYPLSLSQTNPMPVSVMMLAFSFCTWNGFNQALSLIVVNSYSDVSLFHPRTILGILMFFTGFYINISSDKSLLKLRDKKNYSIDNKSFNYSIPYEGLFEYVSCANYFGEILEWTGFAVACWSLPAFSFAFYTFSNLAPRALKHHAWYLEKFDDYPRSRKAVIPFIL